MLILGTQQLSRLRYPTLDTSLTSGLFGTTRPWNLMSILMSDVTVSLKWLDRAETWYIAAFEVGESDSGDRFDLQAVWNHSTQPKF